VNRLRSVVRVAAYLPAGTSGGYRVAGFDEDAFTMGATAVERVWADRDFRPGHLVVHLLGEFPAMADWGFAALLGQEAEVIRHPGDAGELGQTLRALEAGLGGPALLIVTDLPERIPPGEGRPPAPPGAGAIAFLLESAERSKPFHLEKGSPTRSAVAALWAGGKPRSGEARTVEFLGDWSADPARGRPVDLDLVGRLADRDASAVSEGAYVPRARYLENLPSRWRLAAEECAVCHEVTFPARGNCRRCSRKDELTTVFLPRDGGRVVAVTTIGRGGQPTEFDRQVEATGPYMVALVDLVEGTRGTLQVTDAGPGELHVGDRVQTQLRRLYPMEGEWRYGRKAAPVRPGDPETGSR